MKWFTYFDNSHGWHGSILLLTQAASITEADEKFKATFGQDALRRGSVSVTITDTPNVD